jgi:hypothetical protein
MAVCGLDFSSGGVNEVLSVSCSVNFRELRDNGFRVQFRRPFNVVTRSFSNIRLLTALLLIGYVCGPVMRFDNALPVAELAFMNLALAIQVP